MNKVELSKYVTDVVDYPKEGIIFKDITPLLNNFDAYSFAISEMINIIKEKYPRCTHIVAPEARGFWFGCPIAINGGYNFVPIRKPNKLPREINTVEYDLEYGSQSLCIHKDALKKGDVVVVIDDILATGGTIAAIETLVKELGASLEGFVFFAELTALDGRSTTKEEITCILQV